MHLVNTNFAEKSYQTEANAIAAIEKIEQTSDQKFMVVMSKNDYNRFVPVLILKESQLYFAAALANKGFMVCRA
jgi:hypothetical protein